MEFNTTLMSTDERLDRLEAWMNQAIAFLDELQKYLVGVLIGVLLAGVILL